MHHFVGTCMKLSETSAFLILEMCHVQLIISRIKCLQKILMVRKCYMLNPRTDGGGALSQLRTDATGGRITAPPPSPEDITNEGS